MKKFILISIFISGIFAMENSYGECLYNYPYNGQRVTYCIGNNNTDYNYYNSTLNYNSYNSNNGYYDNGVYYSNGYNNYKNGYYSNGIYYSNSYNYGQTYYSQSSSNDKASTKTFEDNYYNLIYLNGLENKVDTSKTSSSKDYFEDRVIGDDRELEMIDEVKMSAFSFRSSLYNSKYSEAKKWLDNIKEEVKIRYIRGEISYYKIYDIKNDLDNLTFNLSYQFAYYKKYESSGKAYYKEAANESGVTAKTIYEKLKYTLKNI